ncbi:NlpC/P60 family protein [Paenibacillus sp. yr247]
MSTVYQFGAKKGQTRTFDCSSFTQYVFNRIGVNLPRNSKTAYYRKQE